MLQHNITYVWIANVTESSTRAGAKDKDSDLGVGTGLSSGFPDSLVGGPGLRC